MSWSRDAKRGILRSPHILDKLMSCVEGSNDNQFQKFKDIITKYLKDNHFRRVEYDLYLGLCHNMRSVVVELIEKEKEEKEKMEPNKEFDYNNLLLMIENDGVLYRRLAQFVNEYTTGHYHSKDVSYAIEDFCVRNEVEYPRGDLKTRDHAIFGYFMSTFEFDVDIHFLKNPIWKEALEDLRDKAGRNTTGSNLTETKEEEVNKMSAIKIESKIFINNTEVTEYSEDTLFLLINTAETEIANMEATKNKPKSLKARIKERKQEILDLVEWMDAR